NTYIVLIQQTMTDGVLAFVTVNDQYRTLSIPSVNIGLCVKARRLNMNGIDDGTDIINIQIAKMNKKQIWTGEDVEAFDQGKRDQTVMTQKKYNWVYSLIEGECNRKIFVHGTVSSNST
ncbi:hypothetical protein PFISCL1PPCAC_1695, partial [Pristionchus fissidentatus]